MPVGQRYRQGFTLIEMLIVGSLIVLFAGLAMFGAQQMYDSNRKKAMLDEGKSIASALSFARQDLGFYPRIHLLGVPQHMVYFEPPAVPKAFSLPAMDTYGYYGSGLVTTKINPIYAVKNNWRAPYMTVSQARALNAAGRRSGLVKMRLSDKDFTGFAPTIMGEDPTLVDWPTDTWGNPYVLYQVSSDSKLVTPGQNPKGLRLVNKPTDDGNFFVAVVSYGPDGAPGGNKDNPGKGYGPDTMLYVKGDLSGKNQADFTLKSVDSQYPEAQLNISDVAWLAQFAQSIESKLVNPSKIGITDDGSDDVFYKF